MATHGMVTVVDGNGKVLVKAICGCNGSKSGELAEYIRENRTSDVEEIYKAAVDLDFGCGNCLVVMDAKVIKFDGEDGIDKRYRETFEDPYFNPRWECGKCGCFELVVI